MKKIKDIIFLAILFSSFHISLHSQCSTMHTSLNQRLSLSELIIEGKVIAKKSFWNLNHSLIYTKNSIKITKIFAGEYHNKIIEVITAGGSLENQRLEVNPSLNCHINTYGIFMLQRYKGDEISNAREAIWRPVANQASAIIYQPSTKKAKDVFEGIIESQEILYQKITKHTQQAFTVVQNLNLPHHKNNMLSITSFAPTTTTAGDQKTITISGTEFGAVAGSVFFDAADDGEGGSYTSSSGENIVSWTDTEITVIVPAGAGTGKIFIQDSNSVQSPTSSQTLTIDYNLNSIKFSNLSEMTPRLINDFCSDNGGYEFHYMISTANGGVNIFTEAGGHAKSALQRAVTSWNNNGFAAYLDDICGTTMNQSPSANDVSKIGFDSDTWDLDTQSSSSTLGVCYTSYGKCGSSEWEIQDIDIIFRRNGDPNNTGGSVTWEYGGASGADLPSTGEIDFESVALHELGHATMLGHVNFTGQVMNYSVSLGTHNRTLSTNDMNGALVVQDSSINYSPPMIVCGADYNCNRQYLAFNSNSTCLALPVELSYFLGKKNPSSISLSWQTELEINNKEFVLQKSENLQTFSTIATIQGQYYSHQPIQYQHLDKNPFNGDNYYKLKQIDKDGTETYLGKVLHFQYESDQQIFLYPNPILTPDSHITLTFNSKSESPLNLSLINLNSQIIHQQTTSSLVGQNQVKISTQHLPKGTYFVSLIQDKQKWVKKFVKI